MYPILRFAFLSLVVSAVSLRAQTVETFATFPGSAASPWIQPWLFNNEVLGTASASLSNTAPLTAGGGQYLSVTTQHAASGDNLQFASFLTRTYTSAPGFDLNGVHGLSFQFRLDDLVQGGGTNLRFGGMRNGAFVWELFMGFPAISQSHWLFLNGTGSGGGLFVDTGLTPTLGHVYEMNMTFNPFASTYTARLDDLTSGIFASGVFNFMTTATLSGGVTEDFRVSAFTASAAPDKIVYSLDNVTLRGAAVPEPATYGVFAALVLALGIVRSRFRARSR